MPTFRRRVRVRAIEVAVTYARDDERVSGCAKSAFFLRWAIVLLLLTNTSAECPGTNHTSPYAYNGGSFSVTVTFKAFTSYELSDARLPRQAPNSADRIEMGIPAYDCQPVLSGESGNPNVVVRNRLAQALQLVAY